MSVFPSTITNLSYSVRLNPNTTYQNPSKTFFVPVQDYTGGGGGGGGVTQIIAGSGISISPGGGTGAVTITNTGGGGGGGNGFETLFVSTLKVASQTVAPGGINYGIEMAKNPDGSSGTVIQQTYWAGQGGYNLTPTFTQKGNSFTDVIGAEGMRFGSQGGSSIPYGYIVGLNDGVVIRGVDGNGNQTQDWINAQSGQMKLMCVSTMTDSQKTHTLDFSAFISTMASVYPAIVSAYTPS